MAELLSVGIDIGTSTTQVIFSRLSMENTAGYFAVPRVSIVDKEVVYKSPVYTTPLKTDVLIDVDAVREIVEDAFARAGFTPADTGSGAVIITGEAARKENADAVLSRMSDFAGEFVVSAAGPDLESVIAGKGSGAWQYSKTHHCRVANLDIGGGTTNIVIFDDGETAAQGCYDIGGRLICVEPADPSCGQGCTRRTSYRAGQVMQAVPPPQEWRFSKREAEEPPVSREPAGKTAPPDTTDIRRVTKVSQAAVQVAKAVNVRLAAGETVSTQELRAVTDEMAQLLSAALGLTGGITADGQPGGPASDVRRLLAQLQTPGSTNLVVQTPVDAVFFSGGVADMIDYEGTDIYAYGDIGVLLGRSVKDSALCRSLRVMKAGETIRATVIGAGAYTTTISGSTITYSADIFPLKNIPVIRLNGRLQAACFDGEAQPVLAQVRWFLSQSDVRQFALAMEGPGNPSYKELKQAAACLHEVFAQTLAQELPVLLIVESDIAKALGQMLGRGFGTARQVVVIDGIRVDDGDYVDVGKPVMNGMVLPVVVKTLVFG